MRPLSLAAAFAALCSFSVGVTTAPKYAAEGGSTSEAMGAMVAGLAEAFALAFVAFPLLAVAWLPVVLGMRRRA